MIDVIPLSLILLAAACVVMAASQAVSLRAYAYVNQGGR
jgi:hypothetical protein